MIKHLEKTRLGLFYGAGGILLRGGDKARDAVLLELREKVFKGSVLKAFRWDASQGRRVLEEVK